MELLLANEHARIYAYAELRNCVRTKGLWYWRFFLVKTAHNGNAKTGNFSVTTQFFETSVFIEESSKDYILISYI